MSAEVHPLFRSAHVVHSVCNALCSVFGVDFSRVLKRNEMGHIVSLLGVPRSVFVRGAYTVYLHCMALSTTCKTARDVITRAFNMQESYYFIFHLLFEAKSHASIYTRVVMPLVYTPVNDYVHNQFGMATGAKNTNIRARIKHFSDGGEGELDLFIEYETGKRTRRRKLLTSVFPNSPRLFEADWRANALRDDLLKRREIEIGRLTLRTRSKRKMDSNTKCIAERLINACKRQKILP